MSLVLQDVKVGRQLAAPLQALREEVRLDVLLVKTKTKLVRIAEQSRIPLDQAGVHFQEKMSYFSVI